MYRVCMVKTPKYFPECATTRNSSNEHYDEQTFQILSQKKAHNQKIYCQGTSPLEY